MSTQKRIAKIIFNVSGGNAGGGAFTTRVTLPSRWVREMNIMPDDREVIIEYDKEKQRITIQKANATQAE